LIGLLALIFANAAASQTFSTENDLTHTVKIPAAILNLLGRSEEVKNCLENYEQNDKFGEKWFRAVKLNLTGRGYTDYLVKSERECLFGPRAATFWIFSPKGRAFRQVFSDSVIDLTIKRTTSRGYKDIQTETTMVNVIRNTWKFDGRIYKLTATKLIEPGK
jgi:hypothetical protein